MEDKTLQSTSPLGAADVMGTITTIHLVLIALFAVAAILVIWWGRKRKAERRAMLHEMEDASRITAIDPDATEPSPAPVESNVPPLHAPALSVPQPIPVAPSPPPLAEPTVTVPVGGDTDLTRLKGLGPKVAARLVELGVTRLADLAALNDDQAEALDAQLGSFRGRMMRDRWVEQARLLNAGDIAGYELRFGKLS